MKNVQTFYEKIKNRDSDLLEQFKHIYGDKELIEERLSAYENLLLCFMNKFGNADILIARSPGRVNIMGKHIDHRGGFVNSAGISCETLLAISPRDDDIVSITNFNSEFKDYEFSISEIISLSDEKVWLDFLESDNVKNEILKYKGEWVNYIKSVPIKMQYEYPDKKIKGMNIAMLGNIPPAAGLSSSSSIVTALMEAVVKLNDISLDDENFVRLCGEGEWYVGARGGAGDHAAMKYGQSGQISKIGFHPVKLKERVTFDDNARIIVANSFVKADKSGSAKNAYNRKTASYNFGVIYIKKNFPEHAEKIVHLRDVSPENLGVDDSEILRMILSLPEKVSPEILHQDLAEYIDQITALERSYDLPEFYEIRSITLYGIAECERAKRCADLLKESDFDSLGEMMLISHDGDRVYKDGKEFDYYAHDEYILSAINSKKQVWEIPGGYACSVKEIDEIVDFIKDVDGVYGAEISGAGLGGCMIIISEKNSVDNVMKKLKSDYYDKNNYPFGAYVFVPIEGSGVIE